MSSAFGTKASVSADLNLLLHVFLLVVLLVGLRLGKNKTGGSLKMHGRLMTVLVVLNGLSILLVMGPSLFTNLGAAAGEIFVISFPLTLFHHSIGLVAEILGATLIFKKFGKVRFWMRVTFFLWLGSLLFGIGFYVVYYVA
jgi:uncharacterized membrane protein YozB (DUF420 family)